SRQHPGQPAAQPPRAHRACRFTGSAANSARLRASCRTRDRTPGDGQSRQRSGRQVRPGRAARAWRVARHRVAGRALRKRSRGAGPGRARRSAFRHRVRDRRSRRTQGPHRRYVPGGYARPDRLPRRNRRNQPLALRAALRRKPGIACRANSLAAARFRDGEIAGIVPSGVELGIIVLSLKVALVGVGFALLLLFGRRGVLGEWLADWFGIVFAFRWTGAALAAAIMGFPLMVRAIRLSIAAIDRRLETFARSLGEFGATITFVSNIPGETETLPLAIYSLVQSPGGDAQALRLSLFA